MAVRDVDGKYAELQEVGNRLLDEALSVLYKEPEKPSGELRTIVVNSLPGQSRHEVLEVDRGDHPPPDAPHGIQLSRDGKSYFSQAVTKQFSLSGEFTIEAVQGVKGERLQLGEKLSLV